MLARLLIVCAFLLPISAQAAVVNFVDAGATDWRVASVEDLNVGGTLYDITYHYDTTWLGLGINSGISTEAEATAISIALRDTLNPLNIPAPLGAASFSTDLLHVWQVVGTQVFTEDTFRAGNNPLVYSVTAFNPNDTNFGTRVGWAEVTSVVNTVTEPAAVALLGLGLVGFGFVRRRR